MAEAHTEKMALSIPDFCNLVGISTRLFSSLSGRGEGPPTIKLGRRLVIRPEAGIEWLKSLENKAA